MTKPARRPFYDEYAWAYDLIIPPPTPGQLDFIASALAGRGAGAGSLVLDAGCGTGRYAIGLARRGYVVEGVDNSPGLLDEACRNAEQEYATDSLRGVMAWAKMGSAERRLAEAEGLTRARGLAVSFRHGDILETDAPARYDGLLCRGVLNDLLDGRSRRAAFRSFARALRPGGAVVLDVREWEGSARRKGRGPVFEKIVETEHGILTFLAVTWVDRRTRRLVVDERHTLRGEVARSSAYEFQMRCWTRRELEARLTEAGFADLEFFGGYDRGTPAGATDRLVCVATLGRRKDEG